LQQRQFKTTLVPHIEHIEHVEEMEGNMNIVSFTEARNGLKSVLDQVVNDANCTVITRRDAADAVVMSLDHYNGLMETVHLLSSPANASHLAESISQYRNRSTSIHTLTND